MDKKDCIILKISKIYNFFIIIIGVKIILTDHTKKRMAERAINFKQVQETIELPEYTVQKEHKTEAYKHYNNKLTRD